MKLDPFIARNSSMSGKNKNGLYSLECCPFGLLHILSSKVLEAQRNGTTRQISNSDLVLGECQIQPITNEYFKKCSRNFFCIFGNNRNLSFPEIEAYRDSLLSTFPSHCQSVQNKN
ncbi:hypothetical protein CEXT_257821 [Caerostris extrusa]|uniref:Uncharacterized protein n=1 Tax=Caerostris extrusa TaxID=172846 RepID=A0AAV4XKG2_CAEEX|nr:hypothetical protein CEXT_257821 [Caerostris extrusa]